MAIDFNILASKNYATLINDVNDTAKALVKMALVGDENDLPVNAIRFNNDTGIKKFQQWTGSAWSNIVLGNDISGNAGTVTNGVYTTGDQTIAGIKTFNDSISVDTINEKTSANGVIIDGVTLKDGGGTFSGKVGIGRTPTTYELEIEKNSSPYITLYRNAGTGNGTTRIGTDSVGSVLFSYDESGNPRMIRFVLGDPNIISSIEAMRITPDGNVGIGKTPTEAFDVKGRFKFDLSATPGQIFPTNGQLILTAIGGNRTDPCIMGRAGSTGGDANLVGLGLYAINRNNEAGFGEAGFYLRAQKSGGTALTAGRVIQINNFTTELFNIDYAGNTTVFDGQFINSGTHGTSPALSVSGAGTRMFFYPRKSAFRAGYVNGTQWDDANIGDYSVAMGRDTIASGVHSTAMGYLTAASGNASTAMGRTTIASGNDSTAMGRATTASGQYSLVSGRLMHDGGDTAFMWGRSDFESTTDYNIKTWRNSDTGTKYGTLKGTWDINGAAITSDIRLKENIKPIDSALDKINLLNPVAFEWKRPEVRHEDDIMGEYGVIAQELEKVFPELITHRPTEDPDLIEDGVQLGVKYTGLIAPMIKAIQELHNIIKRMATELGYSESQLLEFSKSY